MALSGRVGIALGRRHLLHDLLEDLLDADALLRGRGHRLRGVEADDLLDLGADARHVGAGQVDLVDDRDDLEVVVERLVHVRERLRLDALGRVDDQDRALAGGERAGDLVGEVHVTGGVDEVQLVVLPVLGAVAHADGLGLDGDPALALELHVVEELRLRVPLADRAGVLEEPIGERGLAVIDVRDDREVADVRVRLGHGSGACSTRFSRGPRRPFPLARFRRHGRARRERSGAACDIGLRHRTCARLRGRASADPVRRRGPGRSLRPSDLIEP